MTTLARLQGALDVLKARHRFRELAPRAGRDFASNDYLGLAQSELLKTAAQEAIARGVPFGAGGSRLLRGNHSEHEALEAEAAAFFGAEAALFMGGGFQANQAIFSTLPAANDLILHDALVHASAHEGMRLGRAACASFAHNDVQSARDAMKNWRKDHSEGQIWLAVESVYSMEGSKAPLGEFEALAQEFGAILIVDEAHATGVFGDKGRGLAHSAMASENTLSLHTCGKALGVSGGVICGPKVMIDMLINRARPFIFATAPSPLNAAIVRASLRALGEDPSWLANAQARITHAHRAAEGIKGLLPLQSQIIPVILGEDASAMAAAQQLQSSGFDVRAIRPPTVPRGTSRLRISITGNVSFDDITALMDAIKSLQSEAS